MRPRLRLDVSAAQRFILRGLNEDTASNSRQELKVQPRVSSASSISKQQQENKNKKPVSVSIYRQLGALRSDREDCSEMDRCRALRVDRYLNSVSERRAELRHLYRQRHNK